MRDGKPGGNARFLFGQSSWCIHQCNERRTKLTIYRSSFIQGLDSGIGIEIIIDCPQVYVFMNNINAVNNTGGNIALSLTYNSLGTTSKISIMSSIINGGSADTGGGMRFLSQCNGPEKKHTHMTTIIVSILFLLLIIQPSVLIRLKNMVVQSICLITQAQNNCAEFKRSCLLTVPFYQ